MCQPIGKVRAEAGLIHANWDLPANQKTLVPPRSQSQHRPAATHLFIQVLKYI
jgi:hypothetical protein